MKHYKDDHDNVNEGVLSFQWSWWCSVLTTRLLSSKFLLIMLICKVISHHVSKVQPGCIFFPLQTEAEWGGFCLSVVGRPASDDGHGVYVCAARKIPHQGILWPRLHCNQVSQRYCLGCLGKAASKEFLEETLLAYTFICSFLSIMTEQMHCACCTFYITNMEV